MATRRHASRGCAITGRSTRGGSYLTPALAPALSLSLSLRLSLSLGLLLSLSLTPTRWRSTPSTSEDTLRTQMYRERAARKVLMKEL